MSLIGFELLRIVGRRGSFFGAMLVSFGIALLVAFAASDGDHSVSLWTVVIGGPLVFAGTVVAALEGSYDLSQGTMRYLVLTGVPRWRLVAIRVPALLLSLLLIAAPAMVVAAFSMLGDDRSGGDVLLALAGGVTYPAIWGLVAMAIGIFLRSNGAGIAISLVLYLLSNAITAFVAVQVSETVAEYLLPNVAGIVASYGQASSEMGPDSGMIPYGAALLALLAWLGAIVGLAMGRVERDEY